MSEPSPETSQQLVIVARLAEYCDYRQSSRYLETDPWSYMRRKLLETEGPLALYKRQVFDKARTALVAELKSGRADDKSLAQHMTLLEGLLSRGDFADLAIHLIASGPTQTSRPLLEAVLNRVEPTNLFQEERKDPGERSPAWEKLVAELWRRLDFDRLGRIMAQRAPNSRRKAVILRRVRRNVAEYCTVVHIPTSPTDTFTPFMLPRIEGVIAANLRFLSRYR